MIYRDDEEALRAHRRELIVARQEELAAIPPAMLDLYARRWGRIAAGATGVAGMAVLAVLSAALQPGATVALVVAWPAMLLARAIARAVAGRAGMRALHRRYTPSDDIA